MMKVREAQFRRVVHRGGLQLAEVEVITAPPHARQLLAYFQAGLPGSYPLVTLLNNDASHEIDWFDNSLHNAFEVVEAPLASSIDQGDEVGRDDFAAQTLNYGGIREALDSHLRKE